MSCTLETKRCSCKTPHECCHKILFDMLKEFDRICKKTNAKYYLCFGTLLGSVREQDIIKHDEDIDIFLPLDEYHKIMNHQSLPKLLNSGRVWLPWVSHGHEPSRICASHINHLHIDLWIGMPSKDKKYHCLDYRGKNYFYPREFLDEQTTGYIRDLELPIPKHHEQFLIWYYGKNWKTPIKNANGKLFWKPNHKYKL